MQLILAHFFSKILDINICELLGLLSQLLFSLLPGNEAADKDLLVEEQHAVGLLDGVLGSLLGLKVNKSIALDISNNHHSENWINIKISTLKSN